MPRATSSASTLNRSWPNHSQPAFMKLNGLSSILCFFTAVPALLLGAVVSLAGADGFVPLFTSDGPPTGWVVPAWNDVSKPAAAPTEWNVKNGTLEGGEPRGTWLMSEKEYGDFELQYEFKLGERGNSGLALRAPLKGDPAFDGLELQMADYRYNTEAKDSELTGGIYRALAPSKQVYKPTEWNRYLIE